MTEAALSSAIRSVGAPPTIVDVWSRSGSKYRIRAIVLLAVNVLLFAGVGSFAYWLRSGVVFAPGVEGYRDQLAQTFRFGQQTVVSLASLLLEPISIQYVPMQILIVGLLMAALICIPILVSILYRFWSSLPFIAVVGFLAVMPWLAITLLGSCIIASVRPFRSRFRFVSALLGLVPTVVYLTLAWSGSAEHVAGKIDPVDQMKFIAPWVLAIVAAALLFAVVLVIAKIVDYRPGAIAPLLAIMFGLPVALFEYHVGRDELHYRLLEALDRAHFADVDASLGLQRAERQAWMRHPLPRPSRKAIRTLVEMRWLFGLADDIGPNQSEWTAHQMDVVHRCDWFLKYFPESRYALSALFIKGRALDSRIDPAEFRDSHWIRFYDDFPSEASRPTWRLLAENGANSILGSVALLRLAHLNARSGNVDRALGRLDRLIPGMDAYKRRSGTEAHRDGPVKSALRRDRPEASLNISADHVLLEAHRLRDLFARNRDPLYGYDPISGPMHPTESLQFGLMDLIPQDERYVDNLRSLAKAYPNCQIEDNISLEIGKATSSNAEKIRRLKTCLDSFPDGDAVPEAMFRLGVAYRAGALPAESEAIFTRLFNAHRDSIWAREAARYVSWPSTSRVTRVGP